MSSALNAIDTLINKINSNDNMAQEAKENNSESTTISILGMGNPLLDISSPVKEDFLKKYDLKRDNAILAENKHLPMYDELANMSTVEYIGGGSTLNSMRVAQWMSQKQESISGYFGCIGNDKFGQILEKCTTDAGVNAYFMKDEKTATGTCAVCVSDKERSLVANLAAANNFKIDHCNTSKASKMIQSAKVLYSAGFFLTVSVDTMLMVAQECKKSNKPYCMNFSAPFITSVFKEQMLKVLPFVRYIFTNEDESAAFAKANNIEFKDQKDLAVKISKLPSEIEQQRTVVITQGCDPVIVATGDKVNEYPVAKIEKEKIVDLNGAGDAFVGGFLSQLIINQSEENCVAAGNYAAQYMIQRAGTKLEGKPTFVAK